MNNAIYLVSPWRLLFVIILFCTYAVEARSGEFTGELILFPEGCQETNARVCKLGAELTYRSSRNDLVWQTNAWEDSNGESGTTDGASIPKWAQSIIGNPYDESYLKAAIVHDHYCYEENQVRTWRETHRMFYDALIDLGVSSIKAKAMYFAVYLFGPHWVDLVAGEDCGENCIKVLAPSGQRWEGDRYASEQSQKEIRRMMSRLEENPDLTLNEIEQAAEKLSPDYFFFVHGDTYSPKGPDDSNAIPAM